MLAVMGKVIEHDDSNKILPEEKVVYAHKQD